MQKEWRKKLKRKMHFARSRINKMKLTALRVISMMIPIVALQVMILLITLWQREKKQEER
jgi:hypothetical protein